MVSTNKGDWKYGRFVIRAKLQEGLGVLSAIWMVSTEIKYAGWPRSGEIDIMENVGYDPDTIQAATYTLPHIHSIGTSKKEEFLFRIIQKNFI